MSNIEKIIEEVKEEIEPMTTELGLIIPIDLNIFKEAFFQYQSSDLIKRILKENKKKEDKLVIIIEEMKKPLTSQRRKGSCNIRGKIKFDLCKRKGKLERCFN